MPSKLVPGAIVIVMVMFRPGNPGNGLLPPLDGLPPAPFMPMPKLNDGIPGEGAPPKFALFPLGLTFGIGFPFNDAIGITPFNVMFKPGPEAGLPPGVIRLLMLGNIPLLIKFKYGRMKKPLDGASPLKLMIGNRPLNITFRLFALGLPLVGAFDGFWLGFMPLDDPGIPLPFTVIGMLPPPAGPVPPFPPAAGELPVFAPPLVPFSDITDLPFTVTLKL